MSTDKSEFAELNRARNASLASEFVSFAMSNKKWWLLPIAFIMVLMSLLMMAAGSGAAPFIYTLF